MQNKCKKISITTKKNKKIKQLYLNTTIQTYTTLQINLYITHHHSLDTLWSKNAWAQTFINMFKHNLYISFHYYFILYRLSLKYLHSLFPNSFSIAASISETGKSTNSTFIIFVKDSSLCHFIEPNLCKHSILCLFK